MFKKSTTVFLGSILVAGMLLTGCTSNEGSLPTDEKPPTQTYTPPKEVKEGTFEKRADLTLPDGLDWVYLTSEQDTLSMLNATATFTEEQRPMVDEWVATSLAEWGDMASAETKGVQVHTATRGTDTVTVTVNVDNLITVDVTIYKEVE